MSRSFLSFFPSRSPLPLSPGASVHRGQANEEKSRLPVTYADEWEMEGEL